MSTQTEDRSRTTLFAVVMLCVTLVAVVGMVTNRLSEAVVASMISTLVASVVAFITGRATAPPLPPARESDPPTSSGTGVRAPVTAITGELTRRLGDLSRETPGASRIGVAGNHANRVALGLVADLRRRFDARRLTRRHA